MSGYIEKGAIRRHELVGPEIWRMEIELPRTAAEAKPGQFIDIHINDGVHLLRRPISIAGTDPGRGIVEIFYRVVGEGTKFLSHMKEGDIIDSLSRWPSGRCRRRRRHRAHPVCLEKSGTGTDDRGYRREK